MAGELAEFSVVARRLRSNRNDAGSLLASTFVVSLGVGCTLFALIAIAPESRPSVFTVSWVSASALLLWIVRMRFRRTGRSSLSFLNVLIRNRRDDGLACQYEPRKSVSHRNRATAEGNRPISVEELRDLRATSANTWVPARGRCSAKPD